MAIASSYAQVAAGAELHIDSSRRRDHPGRRRAKEDGLDDSSHSRVPSASLRTASAAGGGASGSHSGGTLRGTASAGLGPGLQVLAAPVVRTGSGKPLRAWHALQIDTAEGTNTRAAHARDSAAGSSARDGGPSDAGCVGTSLSRLR
jgi:hypothetical protein